MTPNEFAKAFLLCALAVGVHGTVWADDVPRLDLDAPGRSLEGPSTRVRWFFDPLDPAASQLALGEAGTELAAQLDDFDGRWILEAPAESLGAVERAWSTRGTLVRDISGTPSLLETTTLVGVRPRIWGELEFEGDLGSTVAILDSGCDTAHNDLGDPGDDDFDNPPLAGDAADWTDAIDTFDGDPRVRVVGWHDVTDDLPLAVGPWDYHFHGTAIASAGFGAGRVGDAGRGVAPRARLAIVKTWNFEDRWEVWASDLLLGLEWVLDNAERLRIRACLIGATWPTDPGFQPAIDALTNAGIVVIAPGGNDPSLPIGYPARLDGVLAVGAADRSGRVTSYSQAAPADQPDALDLIAPGGSILDPNGLIEVADNEPNDTYKGRSGSSLAAAHVAGAVNILAGVLRESGRPWRTTRGQVDWIVDLLRATAVEIATAEVPGQAQPRLNRVGPDRYEGYGLLQVGAAVDALQRVVWPGDQTAFILGDPKLIDATWAARVPTPGLGRLEFHLSPAATVDFDLLVYHESSEGLSPAGVSVSSRIGGEERVIVDAALEGWIVVVVKRISGSGFGVLTVRAIDSFGDNWPLRLSADQRTSMTSFDLDADGSLELVAVNNIRIDPSGHNFHAVKKDGTNFGVFPEAIFTDPLEGELTLPTIGVFGSGAAMIAASEFGQVITVEANGDLRWIKTVSSRPLSMPVLLDPGPTARVAIGSDDGIVILDSGGNPAPLLATSAPVSRPLAAGDLDDDGLDDIVAVDDNGVVYAFSSDGSLLDGWPVDLGADCTAPVLRGRGDGSGAQEILVGRRSNSSGASLHRLGRDGTALDPIPIALDLGGKTPLSMSPLAVTPLRRGESSSVFVQTLSGGFLEDIQARLHVIRPDQSVSVAIRTLSERRLDDSVLNPTRTLLAEPRVFEWTGGGDREIVVAAVVGWSELVGGQERRFGTIQEWMTWSTSGPLTSILDAVPRTRGVDRTPSSPLILDLDGDLRPEWIGPRGNQINVFGGRLPEDVDTSWTNERGGAARRACIACEAIVPVDAPVAVRAPRLNLVAAPNPFNPRTRITARVPGAGELHLSVVDVRGRRVRTLKRDVQRAGLVVLDFDAVDDRGRALASGVYHVVARWNDQRASMRLVLVR